MEASSAAEGEDKKIWTLEKESELRFEVGPDKSFTVVLLEQSAEIFGVELAVNTEYHFSAGAKVAVFTWYGCKLQTTRTAEVLYVAKDTPMLSYVNTHIQLEARRDQALSKLSKGEKAVGPRVLVAGATDSGKSSLCAVLCAYAVRLGRTPTFVDLDVGQGEITIPGTVSAVSLDSGTLSIEERLSLAAPLTFFYGHDSPGENPELFRHMVSRLAECVEQRQANDRDAAAAGTVVNTCGWVDGLGLELLRHCIDALSIDIVLVMGHDKLYAELMADSEALPDDAPPRTVVKLPTSGGVVQRSAQQRRQGRAARVREYFYGAPHAERRASPALTPTLLELRMDSVRVCRVGGTQLSGGLLPVGQAALLGPTRVSMVKPSHDLLHAVLAVCHPVLKPDGTALVPGEEGGLDDAGQEIADCNVAGFVYVTEVDMVGRRLVVMSPCPGDLPSAYLLVGGIRWSE
ncbi:Pre-mRNA cleavage complex II protein Clp1-domain-containing protein [Tribonema minus]|uniref:Protein CLP1 homolog n=1 Tax=Tribonema minus TaxID=303371 RepID=A0A835YJV7_9STRA|nr:Pre-mRNA cleavage complex II protein Clp1-domain-containing protein [Tribonema minus]